MKTLLAGGFAGLVGLVAGYLWGAGSVELPAATPVVSPSPVAAAGSGEDWLREKEEMQREMEAMKNRMAAFQQALQAGAAPTSAAPAAGQAAPAEAQAVVDFNVAMDTQLGLIARQLQGPLDPARRQRLEQFQETLLRLESGYADLQQTKDPAARQALRQNLQQTAGDVVRQSRLLQTEGLKSALRSVGVPEGASLDAAVEQVENSLRDNAVDWTKLLQMPF